AARSLLPPQPSHAGRPAPMPKHATMDRRSARPALAGAPQASFAAQTAAASRLRLRCFGAQGGRTPELRTFHSLTLLGPLHGYSVLRASIGSRREALMEGYRPERKPTKPATPVETMMARVGM